MDARASDPTVIVLLNIPNTRNNGVALMTITAISHLSKRLDGNVIFHGDFASKEDLGWIRSELGPGHRVEAIDLRQCDTDGSVPQLVRQHAAWVGETIRVIRELRPRAVVVLAGDDLAETYVGALVFFALYRFWRLSRRWPLVMLSATIGPFRSWRRLAARVFLGRATIITRDVESVDYCRSLGLRRVSRGYELAWLPLPKQSALLRSSVLRRFGCREGQYVVVNPSGGFRHYTRDRGAYVRTWASLITALLQKPSLADCDIVCLPHVLRPHWEDDRAMFAEIVKLTGEHPRLRVIREELPPSMCRELLGGSRFSVCGRMHAAVSTLQSGRPAIALSYSAKFKRVIADELGLDSLVVDAYGDRWNPSLVADVLERLEAVEGRMSELSAQIRARVAEAGRRQCALLDALADSM